MTTTDTTASRAQEGATPQPAAPKAAMQAETPRCDLVMKGGITSGVVYPRLISELAEKYRFKNIGGTSAGAIAAAGCAAAEYGRLSRKNPQGFNELSHLPTQLSDKVGQPAQSI